MRNSLRNIICALTLCTMSAALFQGCRDDVTPVVPGGSGAAYDDGVFFTIYASVAGNISRAAVDTDAADAAVRNLRIVIVSHDNDASASSWEVEHNFVADGAITIPAEYTFKVKPGTSKKIYLLANTGGLVDVAGNALDFSDAAFIPDAATGRAPVDDYVFALGDGIYSYDAASYGIPMSAVYHEQIPVAEDLFGQNYQLTRIYYLVRAATKFSFTFSNESTNKAVELTGYGIASVTTDRMYLYPHAAGADTVAPTTLPADYEIPAGASSVAINRTFDSPISLAAKTGATTATQILANALYLPESRNIGAADAAAGAADQSYTLTLQARESIYGEAATEQSYTLPLPEVTSLFRNTHVWITVTFNDYQLDWEADVAPYDAADLQPEFGL